MLILATESPTKRMIMDRSGLAYEAISANIDERAIEKSHPELDARETAILLARSKAEALPSCILATVLLLLIHSVFYLTVRACIKQKPLPKR